MVVASLREEELTRRDIQEALRRARYITGSVKESEDKNANMSMDFPMQEDYEQELAEAWLISTATNSTQKR